MADWICYAIKSYVGDLRAATAEKGRDSSGVVSRAAKLLEEIRSDRLYEKVMDDYYRRAGK
ncbi:MAG: hypothetical protein QXT33_06975 [Thermofilum sp.]